MRRLLLIAPLACLLTLSLRSTASAEQTPDAAPAKAAPGPLPVLQDRPDAADTGAAPPAAEALRLGEPFRSQALGISVRPPAGFKTVRKIGGDEVDFINEQQTWVLKLVRTPLANPMALEPSVDEKSNLPRAGYLEVTVDRLKATLPDATILRSDVINLGAADAGMIVLRHVAGLETLLDQQALVRASDQNYFVISLMSPGSKASGKEVGNDPAERQAVETFQAVLDSVELLDQRPIRREQDERLYATRAMFVNLAGPDKLQKVLVPRQWFRILRNGKDIGYLYTVEEAADGIPGHKRAAGAAARARGKGAPAALGRDGTGVLIGMRSRTLPGEDIQVDSESWMFCTPDRRSEQWSTLTVVRDLKKKEEDHAMTLGSSTRRTSRVLDREADRRGEQWDKNDPGQPPMAVKDDYQLNVTHVSKRANAQPLSQQLSPWYLPQALGHLLPRLLPVREPKQFMFATYVGEAQAVMHRYVDVGSEKRVTFAGEALRAIPINDRIGLEGSVTTHYVTPDGKYVGSENADSGITVLPSDEPALLKIWKDADLTRPADVKDPAGATQPAARKAPDPGTPSALDAGQATPAGPAPRERAKPPAAR